MAEKTGNEIWDDMKNAQEALVDENLKKYKAEKDNLAVQAEANAAAESAGASADHQNYATPNGVGIQADAISRLGLNKGKLSETNLSGGYNAYQSRLAAAARQAQNSKDQLDLAYGIYGAQSQAEKSNAQANYNAMKNSEYWRQANWDYQLAADKKAEEEARRAMMSISTNQNDVQTLYDQFEAINRRNNTQYKETKPYSEAAIEAENNIKNMANIDPSKEYYNSQKAEYLWEAGQKGASQDELNYLNKIYPNY